MRPGAWARRRPARRRRWGVCSSAMSASLRETGGPPLRRWWAMSQSPRGSCPGARRARLDISALGASCDRSQPAGLRDHAILLLLARLGLRSCEVARLELGDLDWRAGLLRVRGKGGGEACLPLPADVGEAIAAYLRDGRPRAGSPPGVPAPPCPLPPLPPPPVGRALARGCERTGQRPVGPHRLRH